MEQPSDWLSELIGYRREQERDSERESERVWRNDRQTEHATCHPTVLRTMVLNAIKPHRSLICYLNFNNFFYSIFRINYNTFCYRILANTWFSRLILFIIPEHLQIFFRWQTANIQLFQLLTNKASSVLIRMTLIFNIFRCHKQVCIRNITSGVLSATTYYA